MGNSDSILGEFFFFYHNGGRTLDEAAQGGCEPPSLKVFKTGEDADLGNLTCLVLF